MRILGRLLTILILVSCSSKQQSWDSGAQKQQAIEDDRRNEQQERIRNQLPGDDELFL